MERRLVFTGKGNVGIEQYAAKKPKEGEVAIRTTCSLMSTGTEGIVFNRLFDPGTHWDNWVKYPFHPGYAAVGKIESVGSGVTTLHKGDRVMTRCGHGSYHTVEADKCVPVPASVPEDQSTWFALAKIAAMGAKVAEYRLGSSVLVIGAGPIGQMSLRWARAAGAERLAVVDTIPLRLELAKKGGATAVIGKPINDAREEIQKANGGSAPDIVIDTTGNAAVFASALSIVAKFGRVVVLGDTGSPSKQCLTPDVILKGIHIVAAHDPHETPDWNMARIGRLFFALVNDGRISLDGLNTHTFRPEDCVKAYELASTRRYETMGIVFDWN